MTQKRGYQVWKLRVIGEQTQWSSCDQYIVDTLQDAVLLAGPFMMQLSVVDIAILPVGHKPTPSWWGEK